MARGFSTAGDVLQRTVDGRDLNDLWNEFQESLALANQHRTVIASLFTFPTTLPADEVAQAAAQEEFEEASEFGVPKSMTLPPSVLRMGLPFRWYDTATRFTWKFLANASASQVESIHAEALEADNRPVFRNVMRALLNREASAGCPARSARCSPGKGSPETHRHPVPGPPLHVCNAVQTEAPPDPR